MSQDKNPFHATPVAVDLDNTIAQGSYANLVMVNHNETEFTLDFVYVQPQEPKGSVRSRIITSPKHAKLLLHVLSDAVEQYERTFGPLTTRKPPVGGADHFN